MLIVKLNFKLLLNSVFSVFLTPVNNNNNQHFRSLILFSSSSSGWSNQVTLSLYKWYWERLIREGLIIIIIIMRQDDKIYLLGEVKSIQVNHYYFFFTDYYYNQTQLRERLKPQFSVSLDAYSSSSFLIIFIFIFIFSFLVIS